MKCNISVAALLVGLAPSASAKADGGKQLRRSRKLYDDGTTNSKDDGRNYVPDSGKVGERCSVVRVWFSFHNLTILLK